MEKELEKLIKLSEAAELMGIKVQTLWRWVQSGEGPPSMKTPSGMYFFHLSDIKSWLNMLKNCGGDEGILPKKGEASVDADTHD